MKLFDSHLHLTDQSFGTEVEAVLARAAAAGVDSLTTIASDTEDAHRAIALVAAVARPRLRATAGIHPHQAHSATDDAMGELERVARDDLVVALGETGLDFYYENAPRNEQLIAFRAQLELAERLGLPVVVHSREADAETTRLLQEFAGRVVGVLHCFSGGETLLQAGLRAGWHVSFSGIVTFKSYRDVHHVRAVPGDRLLVETDSPYLAPVPFRGRRNEPAFMRHVVERVAEIRGERPEAIAELTYLNACRFYGLDPH